MNEVRVTMSLPTLKRFDLPVPKSMHDKLKELADRRSVRVPTIIREAISYSMGENYKGTMLEYLSTRAKQSGNSLQSIVRVCISMYFYKLGLQAI